MAEERELLVPDEDPLPSTESILSDGSRFGSMHAGPLSYESNTERLPLNGIKLDGLDFAFLSKTAHFHPHRDFSTIDWSLSAELSRQHRAQELRNEKHMDAPVIFKTAYKMYLDMQSWIVLSVVGFLVGLTAFIVHLASEWFSDFRFGHCQRGFWISRQLCCKDSPNLLSCPNWIRWSSEYHIQDAGHVEVVDYVAYVFISVTVACVAAFLVRQFAPYASGNGIAEVKTILGGFGIKNYLSGWTLLIKCVCLPLAVGSGLVLGKEGPLVHIACCIGNICCQAFSKYASDEVKQRELLAASAAAGMSVAFGAPIGGVLFALEEISTHFPPKTMWRSFFCAIIAAIVLQKLNPNQSGKLVMFEVTYHHQWQWFELFPFMLLGAIGGIVGTALTKLNAKICRWRKQSRVSKFPVMELFFLTLFTAMISYTFVYLRGSNERLLAALYSECQRASEDVYEMFCRESDAPRIIFFLFVSALIQFLLCALTYGTKIPAGFFIPSLVIGACLGRLFGFAMYLWQMSVGDNGLFAACAATSQCITPGVYAIVGAAAVMGGVTRMTVSLVVIMFETTGGLEYILPTMAAVVVSKWIADAISSDSIYVEQIILNGYPYLDNKVDYYFSDTAADVMSSRDLNTLQLDRNTVASLEETLHNARHQGFPVVTSETDMLLVGYVSRSVLEHVLARARQHPDVRDDTQIVFSRDHAPSVRDGNFIDLSSFLDQSPIQTVETTPLNRVVQTFSGMGLRYMLVMRHGQLQGIIKKKDILEHIEIFHRRGAAATHARRY